jgi:hypothetical protein
MDVGERLFIGSTHRWSAITPDPRAFATCGNTCRWTGGRDE